MQCEVCGNEYDNSFTLTLAGETYVFDCFECAIHALAPTCAHCGCKMIGHGLSREGEIFCCEHCVRMSLSAAGDREAEDDELEDDALDAERDAETTSSSFDDELSFEDDAARTSQKRRW